MIFILASIGFYFFSIWQILFWTSLWQTKEYRLDRLVVHLKETQQGKSIFFNWTVASFFILIGMYGIGIFLDIFSSIFPFFVVVFFIDEFIFLMKTVVNHRLKRPIPTGKALAIVLLSFLSISLLYFYPLTDNYIWLIVMSILIPFIVSIFVFFFSFPTEVYTDILIERAKKKMKQITHTTVIAVSGSYGKSSTKEIVAHVLSQKYSVVKTSLSNNTPIAVAKTIIEKVTPGVDFFVVEIGAYKKGEVATICDIVHPTISITTSVSDQHLSLYGHINGVIASEMELIHAIPKKGFSLFNRNSPLMKKLIDSTHHKKILYYTTNHISQISSDMVGFSIHPTKKGVTFFAKYKDKTIPLTATLLGVHTIENILPAIYLAMHFGLTDKQITNAVKTLTPLPKTMVKKILTSGVVAVDDTFNASPESVFSAASYAQLYNTKKIFVLTPLIELGKMSDKRHIEIGMKLSDFDYIFLTNKNFLNEIKKGVAAAKGTSIIHVASAREIAENIKKIAKKGDVVVFEGKEAGFILKQLV